MCATVKEVEDSGVQLVQKFADLESRKADLQARFEAFAGALGVLPLDEPAARETGRLRAMREAAGLASRPSDMMIAGIAAAVGAALATRNIKDFAALPIELLDPWR